MSNEQMDSYARVEIDLSACFSAAHTKLDFYFDDSDKARVELSGEASAKIVSIEAQAAAEYLTTIIDFGRQPEVLSESRKTTYYQAKIDWRNLNFVSGETSGKISAVSSEWTLSEIEEFLPQIKDKETHARLAALIESKALHRRAIEIYLETESFIKRHFQAQTKI